MRDRGSRDWETELEQFISDLKSVVRDGQELLRSGLSTLKEQARVGTETTRQKVTERPYPAMGIAFGAGVLAGLMITGAFKGKEEEEED